LVIVKPPTTARSHYKKWLKNRDFKIEIKSPHDKFEPQTSEQEWKRIKKGNAGDSITEQLQGK